MYFFSYLVFGPVEDEKEDHQCLGHWSECKFKLVPIVCNHSGGRRHRTKKGKKIPLCLFVFLFLLHYLCCVCIATFYLLLKWRPLLFWFVALQEEWKGHGELCHKQRENKILPYSLDKESLQGWIFFSNCALTKRDLENVLNCFMLQCIFLKRSRLLH